MGGICEERCSAGPHTNKERLDAKNESNFNFSDPAIGEFRILRGEIRSKSKMMALDVKRADFGPFKNLLGRVPRDKALKGRVAHKCWLISRIPSLQERSIPTCRKSSKNGRKAARKKNKNKQKYAEDGSMDTRPGRKREALCKHTDDS